MKGADYWEQRAIKDKKFATNKTEEYINSRLTKAYSKVSKELEEEISELYKKLDKSRALLSQSKEKLLTSSEASEIKELLKLLEKEKAKLLEAAELPEEIVKNIEENIKLIEESLKLKSTNGYITHLELMNERINSLALSVANENQINMYGFLSSQYKDNYFRGVFRVQQGIGFGKDFISPNPKVVQGIIMKKFAGSSFSKRIWKDANKLATTLKDTLTNGLIRGESIDQMTKRLLTRIDASTSHARTLIRTESARIYEEATKESYKECGIEKYIFLATLDRKTSLICQELDMKSFPLDKAKAGENYPPMHPNCRSTTMADTKLLKRIARGADGKNYEVDGNLSYKDWYDGLSKDEQGRMSLENKKDANRKRDKEEYNELKKYVQKRKMSFNEFLNIKYNDDKTKYNEMKVIIPTIEDFKERLKNGEVNLKVQKNKQLEHIQGSKPFLNRFKQAWATRGRENSITPQSFFYKTQDIEQIIKEYSGKGIFVYNPANKNVMSEYVSVDRAIGRCYNRSTNRYEETRRICIRYTNKGVHLYPTKEVDGHE
jgi:putative phage head morphogenesis protein, SPP1 gp7 family